ncbi:MAG: hypothetical protein LR015_05160, partial [Verrucomicrobia bacterium]|nr:hypothetical protein [Verrucomicrobiota bacterium]
SNTMILILESRFPWPMTLWTLLLIECANQLSWQAFAEAYDDAVRKVRSGIPTSKACTPLILTSMGGFNVRDALQWLFPRPLALYSLVRPIGIWMQMAPRLKRSTCA